MGDRESSALLSRRRSCIQGDSGKMWVVTLVLASVLASQENISVSAFNVGFNGVVNGRQAVKRKVVKKGLPPLFGTASITTEERGRTSGKLSTVSSAPTNVISPQMFLKSGQMAIQPMSSLSSGFFDTSSTSRPRFGLNVKDDIPIYFPQRKRGILGFVLNDDDEQVLAPRKVPPKMDDSSTSLRSSTDEQSSFKLDFETWDLSEHISALSTADDNRFSPILNRSPNTGVSDTEDQDASKASTPAWFPWIPSITQIEALKTNELKQVCSERGLTKDGSKVDLQQRLWEWTRTQQHRQRRLMIGSSLPIGNKNEKTSGRLFRVETRNPSRPSLEVEGSSSTSANSLGEWARTYNIEPLIKQRKKIHKEKREGKTVKKRQSKGGSNVAREKPTKEYLSKLFDAPSSQYSNVEVKQMYKAAKAADQNGDRSLSKQILLKLKDATPHDARIYRRLARMHMEDGDTNKARTLLQEGLRLHPTNAFLWHGLGQLELKAGDDNECRRCFMKAIQSDPAFPNAYHALGAMEHSRGQIARAMKILKTGLQYCPTNHRLHHALGDLYRGAQMPDMAEKSFRRALDHAPDVSKGFTYTSLAHVAYERGQMDACRLVLQEAVANNDGRLAKGWLALARFEESIGDIDVARTVCLTALNKYEKTLLQRMKKGLSGDSKSFAAKINRLSADLKSDPVKLKNAMLSSVPRYRSGDHFLKVYRNWARLEETHGLAEAVDDVYKRAMIAFPTEWKLAVAWGNYHFLKGHIDKAGLLYNEACNRAGDRHARPHRILAEFEMQQGRYSDARKVLFYAARSLSDTPHVGLGDNFEMSRLFTTWAVCEWHLNNLSRAEVLFDHALRLASTGDDGSALRSYILYSIALLEYNRGELHLSQHCICLCLKENTLPNGNSKVWDLWAKVAEKMGDDHLSAQCNEQVIRAGEEGEIAAPTSASVLRDLDVQKMMRKDPWHYKIFDLDKPDSRTAFIGSSPLPNETAEI